MGSVTCEPSLSVYVPPAGTAAIAIDWISSAERSAPEGAGSPVVASASWTMSIRPEGRTVAATGPAGAAPPPMGPGPPIGAEPIVWNDNTLIRSPPFLRPSCGRGPGCPRPGGPC
jgi:hypothetical protein